MKWIKLKVARWIITRFGEEYDEEGDNPVIDWAYRVYQEN